MPRKTNEFLYLLDEIYVKQNCEQNCRFWYLNLSLTVFYRAISSIHSSHLMHESQIEYDIPLLRLSTQEWIFKIWKIALVNWGMTRCQRVFSRLLCKSLTSFWHCKTFGAILTTALNKTVPNLKRRPQKVPLSRPPTSCSQKKILFGKFYKIWNI